MNKYNVYFTDDGEVRKGVCAKDIKAAPADCNWRKMTRDQFITMDFEHEKKSGDGKRVHPSGEYKILRLGKKQWVNKYVCTRIGGDEEKEYRFDMGYVQKKILDDIFPFKK